MSKRLVLTVLHEYELIPCARHLYLCRLCRLSPAGFVFNLFFFDRLRCIRCYRGSSRPQYHLKPTAVSGGNKAPVYPRVNHR